MLSIPNPGKGGNGSYYFKYYSTECEEPGEWFGDGAEHFGLKGEVDRRTFQYLLDGRSPDGKDKLVKNAGYHSRVSHWDLTFSAPKPVSVLYAFGSGDVRKEVIEAHKTAVKFALGYMEEVAGISRQGKGGKLQERASLVGSSFIHIASRAHEPQIHSHCVVHNIGIRKDGSTGSLHSIGFFRHKLDAGALYQTQLAHELRERLGLTIVPEKVGFHIEGVPKELCEVFSTRRKQVEEAMKAEGKEGPAAASRAAEMTRDKKTQIDRDELFARWREVGNDFGWSTAQARDLTDEMRSTRGTHSPRKSAEREKEFRRELTESLEKLFPERRTKNRATRVASELGIKHGVDAKTVREAVKEAKLPISLGIARIEWQRPLKDAPKFNPLKYAKIPVLVVKDPPRKWGDVKAKKTLLTFGKREIEARIQMRKLFPKFSRQNPLSKLAMPALRFVAKKPTQQNRPQVQPKTQQRAIQHDR